MVPMQRWNTHTHAHSDTYNNRNERDEPETPTAAWCAIVYCACEKRILKMIVLALHVKWGSKQLDKCETMMARAYTQPSGDVKTRHTTYRYKYSQLETSKNKSKTTHNASVFNNNKIVTYVLCCPIASVEDCMDDFFYFGVVLQNTREMRASAQKCLTCLTKMRFIAVHNTKKSEAKSETCWTYRRRMG